MGGQIEWAGLDVVAELIGVEDIDALVRDLLTLRDGLRDTHG